ncbi:hypothetical protein ACQCNZ_17425 [Proteus mirabilis]|nr:hypothetical protein [Proteus mirabilis]MCK2325159.1 hypothetical protein [Escherichia coli]EIM6940245.1 hypothetical protein [Proteus mirabilis]EIO2232135.1 hypothetical protein [Proteus mirabilis]EKT9732198.1 hypothetical protein [Proteus mirabilis]EKU2830894.1 hypothetical protein [Proteus mirabilis]
MKPAFIVFIVTTLLAGCASISTPVVTEKRNDNFSKYSDLQLCKTKKHYEMDELNVNPSSHPEYNENLRRYKAISNEIDNRNTQRIVNYCYKLINKDLLDNLTPEQKEKLELTPRQKRARALATCQALGGTNCNPNYEY